MSQLICLKLVLFYRKKSYIVLLISYKKLVILKQDQEYMKGYE